MFKSKNLAFLFLTFVSSTMHPMQKIKEVSLKMTKRNMASAFVGASVCLGLYKGLRHYFAKPQDKQSTQGQDKVLALTFEQQLDNVVNPVIAKEVVEPKSEIQNVFESSLKGKQDADKKESAEPAQVAPHVSTDLKKAVRWHRYITNLEPKDLCYFLRTTAFPKLNDTELQEIVKNILNEKVSIKELKDIFSFMMKKGSICPKLQFVLSAYADTDTFNDEQLQQLIKSVRI